MSFCYFYRKSVRHSSAGFYPDSQTSDFGGTLMRVSDDRYSRDRLRLDLALRFIQHEARTQTIRHWTGLSDDRIRKLYRSYAPQLGRIVRPRGKSPQQVGYFLRSPRLQQETALLASVCSLLGALPQRSTHSAGPAPGVARGEILCQAFEAYQMLLPAARISFEHMIFLVVTLGRGEELRLAGCCECGALLVTERIALRELRCGACVSGRVESEPASGAAVR
jgi:hypothetical protein